MKYLYLNIRNMMLNVIDFPMSNYYSFLFTLYLPVHMKFCVNYVIIHCVCLFQYFKALEKIQFTSKYYYPK